METYLMILTCVALTAIVVLLVSVAAGWRELRMYVLLDGCRQSRTVLVAP